MVLTRRELEESLEVRACVRACRSRGGGREGGREGRGGGGRGEGEDVIFCFLFTRANRRSLSYILILHSTGEEETDTRARGASSFSSSSSNQSIAQHYFFVRMYTHRRLHNLQELNHGRLKPSERSKRKGQQRTAGLGGSPGEGGGGFMLPGGGGGGSGGGMANGGGSVNGGNGGNGGGGADENDVHVTIDVQRMLSRSNLVAAALSSNVSRRASPSASPRASDASASFHALGGLSPGGAKGERFAIAQPGAGSGAVGASGAAAGGQTRTSHSPPRTYARFIAEDEHNSGGSGASGASGASGGGASGGGEEAHFAPLEKKEGSTQLIKHMQSDLQQKSKELQAMIGEMRRQHSQRNGVASATAE